MERQKSKKKNLLSPESLVKIKDLSLVAKGVVEGFVAGQHKSPYRGYSLEFAEHRKYVLGDELKHLDWKVYGRTQKFFVKMYEAETNMRVYLILDSSKSMSYSSGGVSKLRYASCLMASLAYLASRQQDLVGTVLFNDHIEKIIPPKNSPGHIRKIMDTLQGMETYGSTNITGVLQELAQKMSRRALLVIVSDLFDNQEQVIDAVRKFRHRKHEIILFHVMDNAETVFPFKNMTTFKDLESSQKMSVDPLALRLDYLKGIQDFKNHYKVSFGKMGVDYQSINTIMPFDFVLSSYLNKRRRFG